MILLQDSPHSSTKHVLTYCFSGHNTSIPIMIAHMKIVSQLAYTQVACGNMSCQYSNIQHTPMRVPTSGHPCMHARVIILHTFGVFLHFLQLKERNMNTYETHQSVSNIFQCIQYFRVDQLLYTTKVTQHMVMNIWVIEIKDSLRLVRDALAIG